MGADNKFVGASVSYRGQGWLGRWKYFCTIIPEDVLDPHHHNIGILHSYSQYANPLILGTSESQQPVPGGEV
jgi:hypothetical protein